MTGRLLAILAAGATLLFVACGGDDKADTVAPQPTGASSPAAAAASSPTAVPSSSATARSSPTPAPTEAVPTSDRLTGYLLRLEDLPSGYTLDTSPDDDDDDDEEFCDATPVTKKIMPTAKASADF